MALRAALTLPEMATGEGEDNDCNSNVDTHLRHEESPSEVSSLSLSSDVEHDEDTEQATLCPFDCNICLEPVSEPVVTHCGHLYCWPCLYRWLEPGILPSERKNLYHDTNDRNTNAQIDRNRRCCPVCKSECSIPTVVPIYVRNDTPKKPPFPKTKRKRRKSKKHSMKPPSSPLSLDRSHQTPSTPIPNRPQPTSTQARSSPTQVRPQPHIQHNEQTPFLNTHDNILRSSFHQTLFPMLGLGAVRHHIADHQYYPSLHRPTANGNGNFSTPGSSPNRQSDPGETNTSGVVLNMMEEDATTEFLSRLLLILGSFVVLCLLLF